MKKNQRILTPEGIECVGFPQETMTTTQGPDGGYTHKGTENIDIAGANFLKEPGYALTSCQVVGKSADKSGVVFESLAPVLYSEGTLDFIHWRMYHDEDTMDLPLGKTFVQGEKCYDEGRFGNATGNHIHLSIGRGKYAGTIINQYGNRELVNEIKPWDAMFINGTIIKQSGGYPWKEYKPMPYTPIPTSTIQTKFTSLRFRKDYGLSGEVLGTLPANKPFPYIGRQDNVDGYHWAMIVINGVVAWTAIESVDKTKVFLTLNLIPATVESPINATLTDGDITVIVKRP